MSGSSNNSWTILAPEESTAAAETLRPLTEGTERQDEPAALTQAGDGGQGSEEDHQTAEETLTKPCEETDPGASLPPSAPLEVQDSPAPEPQAEDTPLDTGLSHTEQESFSDSYSHLTPPTEDRPPPQTTETLGQLDSGQEEEVKGQSETEDQTQHHRERGEVQEELKEEAGAGQWSPEETTQEPSVLTESLSAQEPEVRRRRSLLEKIGRHDEEEEAEAEEDFQLPQREDDHGITLNKCILGAVILLGLGTIFISESDLPSVELKDSDSTGKQEWLNPDIAHPAAESQSTHLLNELNKGNDKITTEKTHLQPQSEELTLGQAEAAGGSTEQLQHVEEEHSRSKRDMASLPVLQRALEKMKTELESVSLLKKEVENLRSTLTHLKLSAAATTPPGGRKKDSTSRPAADQQVPRKDKHDRGMSEEREQKSEWKKEQKQRKDGRKVEDKEWKKERFEGEHKDGKFSKSKEWKKDKSKRGDEGKPWKEKNEKKEWTDRGDKKSKQDKFKEGKEWRGGEERKEFKKGKHYEEKDKGPGNKQWKREKNGRKEDEHKDKFERKPWKERERRQRGDQEQKKWKKEGRRQWSEEDDWNVAEKKHQNGKFEKHTDKWVERKHPKPSVGQPEYWVRQRERLQHSSKPPQPCESPEACAQTEGVRAVHYAEFQTILQSYLSKAQTAGADASHIDELKKLAAEMFQNGVFPHHQMSFQDYVEDVGDILEDLVEGDDDSDDDDDEDGQNDRTVEEEMEGFEREVMLKFTLPGSGEQGRVKGESGRGRA